MNSAATPAYTKDNPFTRLMDRVGQLNASEGKPAGRAYSGGDIASESYVTAIPANRVRSLSPQEAARLDSIPMPMTPAEINAANSRAASLGLVSDDDMPMPTGNTDTSGGPTDAEIEAMLPARFRDRAPASPNQTVNRGSVLADLGGAYAPVPVGTPVQFGQFQVMPSTTRGMPNFQNVQGFNLEKGVAVIDGIEYPLPETDIQDMKKYALTIVLDVMVIQVASALAAFGLTPEQAKEAAEKMRETASNNAVTPKDMHARKDSGTEAVQAVPIVKAINNVPQEQESVQGLPEDSEYFLGTSITEESVQENSGRSSESSESETQLHLDLFTEDREDTHLSPD